MCRLIARLCISLGVFSGVKVCAAKVVIFILNFAFAFSALSSRIVT